MSCTNPADKIRFNRCNISDIRMLGNQDIHLLFPSIRQFCIKVNTSFRKAVKLKSTFSNIIQYTL